jgi:dTDP-4-dehydrorhamnose reductase
MTPPPLDPLRGKTFLITGAGGMLGTAFHCELASSVPDVDVVAAPRERLDVSDRDAVMALADRTYDFILHCAAEADADRCERDPDACRRTQVGGTLNIIDLARETGATVYYPQSVFIFDGSEVPITESTEPAPVFAYGRLKWEAEQALRAAALPGSLIVRMAGFFGGEERDKNFVGTFSRHLIALLIEGKSECGVGDRRWQPTYTIDLARNTLRLLAAAKAGVYNMACHGEASFFDVAGIVVEALGLSSHVTLYRRSSAEFAAMEAAPRPLRVLMENRRLIQEGLDFQRPWQEALREYLDRPYFRALKARVPQLRG